MKGSLRKKVFWALSVVAIIVGLSGVHLAEEISAQEAREPCPEGQVWSGNKCTTVEDRSCSQGFTYVAGRGCVKEDSSGALCGSGQVMVGGRCQHPNRACDAGEVYRDGACQPRDETSCRAGFERVEGYCRRIIESVCPSGRTWDSARNRCIEEEDEVPTPTPIPTAIPHTEAQEDNPPPQRVPVPESPPPAEELTLTRTGSRSSAGADVRVTYNLSQTAACQNVNGYNLALQTADGNNGETVAVTGSGTLTRTGAFRGLGVQVQLWCGAVGTGTKLAEKVIPGATIDALRRTQAGRPQLSLNLSGTCADARNFNVYLRRSAARQQTPEGNYLQHTAETHEAGGTALTGGLAGMAANTYTDLEIRSDHYQGRGVFVYVHCGNRMSGTLLAQHALGLPPRGQIVRWDRQLTGTDAGSVVAKLVQSGPSCDAGHYLRAQAQGTSSWTGQSVASVSSNTASPTSVTVPATDLKSTPVTMEFWCGNPTNTTSLKLDTQQLPYATVSLAGRAADNDPELNFTFRGTCRATQGFSLYFQEAGGSYRAYSTNSGKIFNSDSTPFNSGRSHDITAGSYTSIRLDDSTYHGAFTVKATCGTNSDTAVNGSYLYQIDIAAPTEETETEETETEETETEETETEETETEETTSTQPVLSFNQRRHDLTEKTGQQTITVHLSAPLQQASHVCIETRWSTATKTTDATVDLPASAVDSEGLSTQCGIATFPDLQLLQLPAGQTEVELSLSIKPDNLAEDPAEYFTVRMYNRFRDLFGRRTYQIHEDNFATTIYIQDPQ